MRDLAYYPLFTPVYLLFLRPEFWEKDECLESRRQILLPIGTPCGRNIHRVLVQMLYCTSVMREGPVDIDQFIELAKGLAECLRLVRFI